MARVFLSHSSRDREPSADIKSWLERQGFDQIFLDFDKHAGIQPGSDWERTLYREIERSEAVLIILTPAWLESKWCFAEFTQARALGKAIFPIIVSPVGDRLISPDIQHLNLLSDRDGGLDQLSDQLTDIALNAQSGFDWDQKRSPFPGLLAFQEQDAAIYFGRDDEIRRLIERLNARRAQGGAKLLAILGASGSGKSSLMRAGVLPRMKRDQQHWIVLPTIRPQQQPFNELIQAIAIYLGKGAEWRRLRDKLRNDKDSQELRDLAADLRMHAKANEALIVIPIDQAEELFTTAQPEEVEAFFNVLNSVAQADLPFLAVMTIRSDFLGLLQAAEHRRLPFDQFSLEPMPFERIAQIIEGPAKVANITIEQEVVRRATQDAKTKDALPLLAFALRELYRFGISPEDRVITIEEYEALGDETENISPLENAVRKSADAVIENANVSQEDLQALREAFVPELVQVNSEGDYVRRPAHWNKLPAKSHVLLDQLVDARLLIRRQDENGGSILEVAHEALLRKWPRLRNWLDEDQDKLRLHDSIRRAAEEWHKEKDEARQRSLLVHREGRLQDAEALMVNPRFAASETPVEKAYLAACIRAREEHQAQKRAEQERRIKDAERLVEAQKKTTRRTMMGLVVALVLALVAGVSSFLAAQAKNSAEKQSRIATQAKKLAQEQREVAQTTAKDLDKKVLELLTIINVDQILAKEGTPGTVEYSNANANTDERWERLLQDRSVSGGSTSRNSILTARNFGQGRVMVAAHEGVLNFCDPVNRDCSKFTDERLQYFFLELATGWLSFEKRPAQSDSPQKATPAGRKTTSKNKGVRISLSSGHCEIIPDYYRQVGEHLKDRLLKFDGYSVKVLESPLNAERLAETDVLIVGNAWGNFIEEEIEAVQQFVKDGGACLPQASAGRGSSI